MTPLTIKNIIFFILGIYSNTTAACDTTPERGRRKCERLEVSFYVSCLMLSQVTGMYCIFLLKAFLKIYFVNPFIFFNFPYENFTSLKECS